MPPRPGCRYLTHAAPALPDHARATVEMSREKSGDFPKNRPELSAISPSIAATLSGRHGVCRNDANEMRHNCRRFEDMHDLEPGPRRPYYDPAMLPFPRLQRHMFRS